MEDSIALIGTLKYAKPVISLILRKARSTNTQSRRECKARLESVLQDATKVIRTRRNIDLKTGGCSSDNWLQHRDVTIDALWSLSEDMRKIKRSVNITQLLAAIVAVLSSLIGIIGILVSTFSLWLSFGFIITAVGLTWAGEACVIAMQGAEVTKIKHRCVEARRVLDEDTTHVNTMLSGDHPEISRCCSELSTVTINLDVNKNEELITIATAGLEWSAITAEAATYIVAAIIVFRLFGVGEVTSEASELAENYFYSGSTVLSLLLGVVLNMVGIALDLWTVIDRGVFILRGSKTNSSREMYNLYKELKKEKKHLVDKIR